MQFDRGGGGSRKSLCRHRGILQRLGVVGDVLVALGKV